jgi:hypothetical protein
MTTCLQSWLLKFQSYLESYYALEHSADVYEFLREGSNDAREHLLVREDSDGVSLALVVSPNQSPNAPLGPSDEWAQLIEGVSHFLVLAERARRELSTSQLELELQAEIDKFVLFAFNEDFDDGYRTLFALHQKLYEEVRFIHDEGTVEGVRYRLANRWAARYLFRMMEHYPKAQWRERLCAFYHAGPTEKISMLNAA